MLKPTTIQESETHGGHRERERERERDTHTHTHTHTYTLLADYYVAMSITAIAIDTTNCRCGFLENVIRVIAERERERERDACVVEA
jgi:hypothetical protein